MLGAVLVAAPTLARDAPLEMLESGLAPSASLESLRVIESEGRVLIGGAEMGRISIVARRDPPALRQVVELAGVRQVITLLDERAWIEDGNDVVREATGEERISILLSHSLLFHGYVRGSTDGLEVRVRDSGTSGVVLVLRTSDAAFDRELHAERIDVGEGETALLPARFLEPLHGTPTTTTFEDWRLVEGVRFPFRSRLNTGDARFELETVTDTVALSGELAPGAIPVPSSEAATDATILDPSLAADIPFELLGNLVYVQVEVNGGSPLGFVLDTGAGATVLSTGTAGDLGLPARGRMEARGAGGSEEAAFVDVESLRLPGVELRDQVVVTVSLDALETALGERVDGLLGYDFLSRFAVEIDYSRRRLALHAPGTYEPPEGAASVPLRIESNVPRVEGSIEEFPAGSFLLDTGNNQALLVHSPFVKEHSLEQRFRERELVTGIGGAESFHRGTLETVTVGGASFHDVPALLSTSRVGIAAMGGAIGNLGSGLFSKCVLAFDYGAGSAWILTSRTADSASSR